MKFQSIVLGLALSTSVFADFVTVDGAGKSASIMGSFDSASSEILELVDKANDYGYRNSKGADIFIKESGVQGTRSYTTYKNKSVEVSLDAAFAVIYKADFRGQTGDMILSESKNVLKVSGQAAKVLMGAMLASSEIDTTERVQTESGKVACTKAVSPRSVANCVIKLK